MEHEVRIYDDPSEDMEDDLLPEYHFDYSKAKLNPYADRAKRRGEVVSEEGSAEAEGTSAQEDKS